MSETAGTKVNTYTTPLSESLQIRTHIRSFLDGSVDRFAVTLECKLEGRWKAVVRYDNTGGQVHRDRLLPNGDYLTHREPVSMGLDLHAAVTAARGDLSRRCEWYLSEFFTHG